MLEVFIYTMLGVGLVFGIQFYSRWRDSYLPLDLFLTKSIDDFIRGK